MKELLLQYARYNVWANKLILDTILKQSNNAVDKEMVSSFRSIRATVYHTWSAEHIWLQRLQLVEHPVWAEGSFSGTFDEAVTAWTHASANLVEFVSKQYYDLAFEHVLQFYDRQKVSHKMPVYQVLHHVFNHSTYHRGQLVTMLRQAGATTIPGTDFVTFARGK